MLIGKRVVDFLLVLMKLFSLGVTAEALSAKIDRKSAISLQRGQFHSKVHTKKLCNRLSASEVRFYTRNGRFAFLNATYNDHLRLIGKRVA